MKTRMIPLLLLTLSGSSVGAQQVVPIDAPIHYVMISPSFANAQALGEPWPETGVVDQLTRAVGEAWWTLEYAEHPFVHRVTNIGSTPFRLIAVTNLGGSRFPGSRADARRLPPSSGDDRGRDAGEHSPRLTDGLSAVSVT